MDFQNEQQPIHPINPMPANSAQPNSLAMVSMYLGIASIPALCLIYPALVFASIAIIFAILSKGSETSMHPCAKTGVITSLAALLLALIMFASTFVLLFTDNNLKQDMMQEYNQIYEQYYGEPPSYNPFAVPDSTPSQDVMPSGSTAALQQQKGDAL